MNTFNRGKSASKLHHINIHYSCKTVANVIIHFPCQAIAEKNVKHLHGQITDATSKFDECSRTLNDFDAAKKKLAVENAELLRQLEEAENQIGLLSKVKATLGNQLEESKKVSEEEGKVKS